jgi:uncharacterized YigZ family protein
MIKEQIKTVVDFNENILKEKGSQFIAKVFPVENEQSALNELDNIRKKYFDATHHCFAFRINEEIAKYSDDGEPKGTAGIRILNAIDHFDLSAVMVVVVRYFGGTKLGVGPLGKAYYNASVDVLSKCQIVELSLFQFVEIQSNFSFLNSIYHILGQFSSTIVNSEFSESAILNCLVKPSIIDKITYELTNLSSGQIKIFPKNEFKYQ